MNSEDWILVRGDLPGQTAQMEIAALLSSFIPPDQIALRPERALEMRTDTPVLNYHIATDAMVDGQPIRTSLLRDGLIAGTLADDHPVMLGQLALRNAAALRDWFIRGTACFLERSADGQRARLIPGSPGIKVEVTTVETYSLAKAAALITLGCEVFNLLGTREAPRFILHRYSQHMRDAQGEPVTHDAVAYLIGERDDTLPLHHPFIVAYRVRLCYEALHQHITTEIQPLIVTPDVFTKHTRDYDPSGLHSMIHPNAPGHVWDDLEKSFVG